MSSQVHYNKFLLKVRAWLFWVPAFLVTIPYLIFVNLLIDVMYVFVDPRIRNDS